MNRDLIVTLTTPELRALIREEVEAVMQSGGASKEAPPDILDCKQVAELIGSHPQTVPKLAARRGLPVYGKLGTHLRFRRADVLAWLARHKP